MKKTYEAPAFELVKFEYKDQVVVASGCTIISGHTCPSLSSGCIDHTQTGSNN